MKREDYSVRSKHYRACTNCQKRTSDCHSSCEEYAKEVLLGIILEAEAKKENAKREDEYAVRERKAIRIAKSCPGAKKQMQKSGYINRRGR